MASEPIIELTQATKYFGDVVAVSKLDMSIKKGISGLLGPNGAGKSTSIKMVTGQISPSHGSVLLFGENPFDNVALKARFGYISEHERMYGWAKAEYFVRALATINMPREEASRRTEEVLKTVDLWDVRDRKLGGFSKGMKQRLKLAQALVHEPELLIADEPFAGLDPLGRNSLMELFTQLQKEGVSILLSSHILHEVERVSKRICLIHRGQAIASGPPKMIRLLIDKHPHRIKVESNNRKKLAKGLIDRDLVGSVTFSVENPQVMQVLTTSPDDFYYGVTRVAEEEKISLQSLASEDDNLEAVFRYLTS